MGDEGAQRRFAEVEQRFAGVLGASARDASLRVSAVVKRDGAGWTLDPDVGIDAWLDLAMSATDPANTDELAARTAALKLMASTYAREVTNLAVQVFGGAGYIEDYPVARLYRDIKLAEIGGGTSEIMKSIVARSESKKV